MRLTRRGFRRNVRSTLKKNGGKKNGGGKQMAEVPGTPRSERESAYVYVILINGIVRYIGKGQNGRMYAHLIEAKRSAARCGVKTTRLNPRMHRRLVEA